MVGRSAGRSGGSVKRMGSRAVDWSGGLAGGRAVGRSAGGVKRSDARARGRACGNCRAAPQNMRSSLQARYGAECNLVTCLCMWYLVLLPFQDWTWRGRITSSQPTRTFRSRPLHARPGITQNWPQPPRHYVKDGSCASGLRRSAGISRRFRSKSWSVQDRRGVVRLCATSAHHNTQRAAIMHSDNMKYACTTYQQQETHIERETKCTSNAVSRGHIQHQGPQTHQSKTKSTCINERGNETQNTQTCACACLEGKRCTSNMTRGRVGRGTSGRVTLPIFVESPPRPKVGSDLELRSGHHGRGSDR